MSRWHQQIKNDPRWHAARAACLERDGYLCVDANEECSEDLQADHVVELAELMAAGDLDLAFDIDNLETRCGYHNRKRYHSKKENRRAWLNPAYPELMPIF